MKELRYVDVDIDVVSVGSIMIVRIVKKINWKWV